MGVFLLLIAIILGLLIMMKVFAVKAKAGITIQTQRSANEIAHIVESCFPKFLWQSVEGQGDINKLRVRLKDGGNSYVISVAIEEIENDNHEVYVWLSQFISNPFVTFGANVAFSKIHSVAKKIGKSHTDDDASEIGGGSKATNKIVALILVLAIVLSIIGGIASQL